MGIEMPEDLKALAKTCEQQMTYDMPPEMSGIRAEIVYELIERIANLEQALREEKKHVEEDMGLLSNEIARREKAEAELSRLRSQVEAYQRPVTDEEWEATKDSQQMNWRYVFDEIIASRQQVATEKG